MHYSSLASIRSRKYYTPIYYKYKVKVQWDQYQQSLYNIVGLSGTQASSPFSSEVCMPEKENKSSVSGFDSSAQWDFQC